MRNAEGLEEVPDRGQEGALFRNDNGRMYQERVPYLRLVEEGFLAQELGREVNTIGSKSNDAAMQHAVVAMKGELERFREQLENLE